MSVGTTPRDRTPERARAEAPSLGTVLRSLRLRNCWTLKAMSEATGIPVSTLTKVEHDRLTLGYDRLQQLSRRLNISFSELFAEPEPVVTARRSIGQLSRAARAAGTDCDYYYLCPELLNKRMVPWLTRIRAKAPMASDALVRYPGEEFIYVLQGRVEVHTEFYDAQVLNAGEFLYLDSGMRHAYYAAEGCAEAVILGLCLDTGECLMRRSQLPGREAGHAADATSPLSATSPGAPLQSDCTIRRELHESNDH
jgi:transcriptional regulator with XRE-family HTH domain